MFKKLVLLLSLSLFQSAFAIGMDYSRYYDCGLIYSNSSFPQSVATAINNSEKEVDISKLKRGESKYRNWFKFVEKGDAGIDKAMKNGNITKVHFVDVKVKKVYVPYFLFLPIFIKQKTTIVYGE